MSAHTLAPRRSLARRSRRASVSTSTASHGKLEAKLKGFSIPTPSMTSSSRRHSHEPLSDHARSTQGLGIHTGESSDHSIDDGVKKESRSPSPTFATQSLLHIKREDSTPELDYGQRLAYASLPPSPTLHMSTVVTPTPPYDQASFPSREIKPVYHAPFSIWDYLREELLATDFDSHQELKWERVSNFLNVPMAIEKTLAFGFIVCLDSFLYTFTILPIRFVIAVYRLLVNFVLRRSKQLPPSQKADILRALLIIISIAVLAPLTDASKIYHSIRGQETIKLYVIFNALEIADRLFTSFGQDILDCVFSRSTLLLLSTKVPVSTKTFRPISYFSLAAVYIVAHSLVLIYQLTSLNVAINSYDHTLITLLVSNQFVEIKGSVFKRFEKDNLFQITCADIVERFTLSLMLFTVALRNLIELSGAEFDPAEGIVLPKSFGWTRGGNLVWTIFYPVMTVLVSEQIVDWLKHAFITKFNHIRPSVYERYIDVLCLDLANGSAVGRRGARKHSYVDQSPLVARRLGFPALPLAVLATIIGTQAFGVVMDTRFLLMPAFYASMMKKRAQWVVVGMIAWVCCVLIKIIIGMNLISYAARRRIGMEAREDEDRINDFGRDPIGEGKDERQYNRDLKTYLDNGLDNALAVPDIGEKQPISPSKTKSSGANNAKVDGGSRKRPKLEELTRFTMVKRIW